MATAAQEKEASRTSELVTSDACAVTCDVANSIPPGRPARASSRKRIVEGDKLAGKTFRMIDALVPYDEAVTAPSDTGQKKTRGAARQESYRERQRAKGLVSFTAEAPYRPGSLLLAKLLPRKLTETTMTCLEALTLAQASSSLGRPVEDLRAELAEHPEYLTQVESAAEPFIGQLAAALDRVVQEIVRDPQKVRGNFRICDADKGAATCVECRHSRVDGPSALQSGRVTDDPLLVGLGNLFRERPNIYPLLATLARDEEALETVTLLLRQPDWQKRVAKAARVRRFRIGFGWLRFWG